MDAECGSFVTVTNAVFADGVSASSVAVFEDSTTLRLQNLSADHGNLIVTVEAWDSGIAEADRDQNNLVSVQITITLVNCFDSNTNPTFVDTDSIADTEYEFQFSTTDDFY